MTGGGGFGATGLLPQPVPARVARHAANVNTREIRARNPFLVADCRRIRLMWFDDYKTRAGG